MAPTLPVNAELAIHLLENTLEFLIPNYNIKLIGSSLGGYYTIYLSDKYDLKGILINPAVSPEETMKKYIGFLYIFFLLIILFIVGGRITF